MIKVLILAAGYGTRLQRDLLASPDHHHLLNVPKALLPLGTRDALITHWLELFRAHHMDQVYIVTNDAAYDAFRAWAEHHSLPTANVVSDGTANNADRLGAVSDIAFGICHFGLTNDHVLVVGGDTLFLRDFELSRFLEAFEANNEKACLVTTYKVPDSDVPKFGILETDDQGRVTQFLEKPQPEQTPSRWACPCFYLFSRQALPLLDAFLDASKGQPKEATDATGKFLAYLYPRFPVATFPISGRIDVGGLASYVDACHYFAQ